ncbi:MAG: SMC-Scp complex subunit ScpB [Anaerolineae bacterium]
MTRGEGSQKRGGGQEAEALLDLAAQVECLLFVADEAVTLQRLAEALSVERSRVEEALEELRSRSARRGIRVQRKGDRVQLITAPEAAPLVERFLGLEYSGQLSPAALEALAIVAYRQPVTRAQVESIRGVNCDGVLRTLVRRGLIQEVGRLEQAGRPILYGTTMEFMQYFGLEDLTQLPPLDGNGAAGADEEGMGTEGASEREALGEGMG